MTRKTTTVGISGIRTELTFGDRYRVRYGQDLLLSDHVLLDRRKNGDLVFEDHRKPMTAVRVKAQSIHMLTPSPVEQDERIEKALRSKKVTPSPDAVIETAQGSVISPRKEGETAAAYLRRLERGLGKGSYGRWIETEAGQKALEDAHREAQRARAAADATEEAPAAPEPSLAASRTRVKLDGKTVAETISPEVLARRERENARNRIWRCPVCKRRTRQAECTNGHPAETAPAGKRKEDR